MNKMNTQPRMKVNKSELAAVAMNKFRKFGGFMAGMIIPIIGLIIAWGLFTAVFLYNDNIGQRVNGLEVTDFNSPGFAASGGWAVLIANSASDLNALSNIKQMAGVVGLGINIVIPVLIGYLGGKQVYGMKGALIGALAVIGILIGGGAVTGESTDYFGNIAAAISGSNTFLPDPTTGIRPPAPNMIFGAIISGPLFAWAFKKFELLYKGKIGAGYTMLVNNFSVGIFGFATIAIAFWGIIPIIALVQAVFFVVIKEITDNNLLPILAIVIEPEKVLFLNNAINHGIFTPLTLQGIEQNGKSVFTLLDGNPSAGFGLILAYYFFSGNSRLKGQASSAGPVQFIGGIHEVYYPFIFVKPRNILYMIAASIAAYSIYQAAGVGATGIVSPGSIISNYTFIEKSANDVSWYTVACLVSGAISFGLVSLDLVYERKKRGEVFDWNPKHTPLLKFIFKAQNNTSLVEADLNGQMNDISYSAKTLNSQTLDYSKISYDDGNVQYELHSKKKYLTGFEYQENADKKGLLATFIYSDGKKKNKKVGKNQPKIVQITNHTLKADKNNVIPYTERKITFDKSEAKRELRFFGLLPPQQLIKVKPIVDVMIGDVQQITLEEFKKSKSQEEQKRKDAQKVAKSATQTNELTLETAVKQARHLYFACEAGLGTSAMGAALIKKMFTDNKISDEIIVKHSSINSVPNDVDFIVTQTKLKDFLQKNHPGIYIYTVDEYLKKSDYIELIQAFKNKDKE